jgi:hypothetical protein
VAFQQRLIAGTLPPGVETMLYAYAYGKPVERVEHSGTVGVRPEDLDTMSDAELLALLAARHAGTNGRHQER